MPQLPADCLIEIFKYLDDKFTLHSCLLVNRLWCEVSVPILWRDLWNYRTLLACLPDESKDLLRKDGVIIPASKSPSFNYVIFIKNLTIHRIYRDANAFVGRRHDMILPEFIRKKLILIKEILKMFMNQTSLKRLNLYSIGFHLPFVTYPGATDCLRNLSELTCDSFYYACPELLFQMS